MSQLNPPANIHAVELPASPAPGGSPRLLSESPLTDHGDRRLEKILAYLQNSLAQDNPLESVLGSMTAGLMRMALWLEEAIEQAMSDGPPSLEAYQDLSAAFATYLKLTGQAGKFAQLEFHSAQARRAEQRDVASLQKQMDSLSEA